MNKTSKNEFLKMSIEEKLTFLNKIVVNGTSQIENHCDFSYHWLSDKLENEDIFYVAKTKKFIRAYTNIKSDIADSSPFSNEEINFIKELYKQKNNLNDIRLIVGTCKNSINKTIPIDKEINQLWNDMFKHINGISPKDLYSAALLEFIEKYSPNFKNN